MHPNMYAQNYPVSGYNQVSPLNGALAMGLAGALISGSVAAAGEFRKVKENHEARKDAVTVVGREALGGGIAWAAGSVVAKTLFRSNVLSIVAATAVAAGVKYAYDGFVSPQDKAVAKSAKTK